MHINYHKLFTMIAHIIRNMDGILHYYFLNYIFYILSRITAAVSIGITLYGGGCVFLVLIASFVEDIAAYSGFHGVSNVFW
jgi:F0F1-type ATP synthase membrane subunit a